MATNRKFEHGTQLDLPIAGASTNDPVVFGDLPGVALADTRPDGTCSVQTDGVFDLEVVGADDVGNAEITAGAIVYLDAGDLNVDATNGTRYGYALEAVGSGVTATIPVKIGY